MREIAQIDFNNLQIPASGGNVDVNSHLTLGAIISAALPYIFTIAGLLLLIYLVFGGLQLMLSQGEPKAAGAAKAHITNALVGFLIIFIAFWVVQIFGLVLGLGGVNYIFNSGGSPKIIPPGGVHSGITNPAPGGAQ